MRGGGEEGREFKEEGGEREEGVGASGETAPRPDGSCSVSTQRDLGSDVLSLLPNSLAIY